MIFATFPSVTWPIVEAQSMFIDPNYKFKNGHFVPLDFAVNLKQ